MPPSMPAPMQYTSGLGTLNMRARSSVNFTMDDLRVITDTCRRACVKVYLTLNTVLYDEDMNAAAEILCKAKECGVSAVIASDIAAIQMARDFGLEVHISTQCNVSNFRALRFYAQWADTVVLARELNLDQVYAIHRQIESSYSSWAMKGVAGKPVEETTVSEVAAAVIEPLSE